MRKLDAIGSSAGDQFGIFPHAATSTTLHQATRDGASRGRFVQLNAGIAHELAYIERRDHWFRWQQWIAMIGFGQNPVMRWARHQLKFSEEMICDEFVLKTAVHAVNQYTNSQLNMAE